MYKKSAILIKKSRTWSRKISCSGIPQQLYWKSLKGGIWISIAYHLRGINFHISDGYKIASAIYQSSPAKHGIQ